MTDDEAIRAVRAALVDLNLALGELPQLGIVAEVLALDRIVPDCDHPFGDPIGSIVVTAHLKRTKTEIDVRL